MASSSRGQPMTSFLILLWWFKLDVSQLDEKLQNKSLISWHIRNKDEYYPACKMMRVRASTVRRRRAQSATTALQKEKDLDNNKTRNHGTTREKKKSVQWADDPDREFHKGPLRKFNSDSYLEFDRALRKLTKVSSILERSATLEKDFEEDLQNIQKRLQTELDLKTTEKPSDWRGHSTKRGSMLFEGSRTWFRLQYPPIKAVEA